MPGPARPRTNDSRSEGAGHQHAEGGGHHVQSLSDILTDDVECAAAAGAGLALHIHDLLDAFQMGRKPAAVGVARTRCPGLVAARVQPGAYAGHRRVEILQGERQLVGIELLGSCAEPVPLECGDDRGQPLDLRQGLGARALQIGDERLLLDDLAACRDQHRTEQRGVVGEVGLDQHPLSESVGTHLVNRPVAVRSGGDRHARDASPDPPRAPRTAPRSGA